MADSIPPFSSYLTFSTRNLVLQGASAAVIAYVLYYGELEESKLARVISDVSQAVLVGANVWHTMSSLKMFRSVPRPTFSAVQSALFPSYFTLMHGVSGLALVVYLTQPSQQHHHAHKLRLVCLSVSHIASAINALFLGPTLTKLNEEVIAMEKKAGVGQLEGALSKEEKKTVNEKCPKYPTTHRRFAILHGLSMVVAMATYVCNITNVAVTGL